MNVFFSILLNTAYLMLLVVISPVLLYRSVFHGKYRNGFKEKFFGLVPELARLEAEKKRIWFHAVSVGEVNVLRPLLAMIKANRPDWECVVSTTSTTGMELAKKLYGNECTVFYCPLDFSWAVNTALKRINPDLLVLTEQELWPNLFRISASRGVKLAMINARFGEPGYKRYKWIRFLLKRMLQRVDLIAVQNEVFAGWFHQLGAKGDTIEVTGSMKFDGAQTDRSNPRTLELSRLAGIVQDDVVILAGSTQAPEETMAVRIFEKLRQRFPKLRLIIVPRHPQRFDSVAQILDEDRLLWQRRSELDAKGPTPGARILLVDTVGELGAWWGTAAIAFVGGSMGSRGGQNMLEPAAYGAAVSFGPNTWNFKDIVENLLRAEAAIVVQDETEFETFVLRCLEEPAFAQSLGRKAKELVVSQHGATQKTFDRIAAIFERTV